jgi:hypothetical protein
VLSPASGEVITSTNIPSSISRGPSDIISLHGTEQRQVVWLEQGTIKSLPLTADLKSKASSTKYMTYKKITDVGLSDKGFFVATKKDGNSRVMTLDSAGSGMKGIWDFDNSVSRYMEQA